MIKKVTSQEALAIGVLLVVLVIMLNGLAFMFLGSLIMDQNLTYEQGVLFSLAEALIALLWRALGTLGQ